MSFEHVQKYFTKNGLGERVIELEQSSATVEMAATALGCYPKEIAKTMSFLVEDLPILIVTAGDAKVDNKKYKTQFQQKAKMIPGDLVETTIGHAPGGVCPFAIKPGVRVYLDVSLKRFEIVYPAAGSGNSAVKLSIPELETYAQTQTWIDVCKDWQE